MSLHRLSSATRINSHHSFERVRYWVNKQQMLIVALEDLAKLKEDYAASERDAPSYELDPRIKVPEPRPRLRLSLAIESVCSCVYAMTEIAANFGNCVTAKDNPEGQLPRSFNQLKKQLRAGRYPSAGSFIGDLGWHDNLHAMRTEWAHFSTIFLGWDNGRLVVVGADLRAPPDKLVLKSRFMLPLETVRELALASILSLDRLAAYLLPSVIAKMDLGMVQWVPVMDANGMLVFRENHTIETRQISVREQLVEMGLGDLVPTSA